VRETVTSPFSRPGAGSWLRVRRTAGSNGYSYYGALFAERAQVGEVVVILHHEPGRAMVVDRAGDTLGVVAQSPGRVTEVYRFTMVLPYAGAVSATVSRP
jgi:hypothetical protein